MDPQGNGDERDELPQDDDISFVPRGIAGNEGPRRRDVKLPVYTTSPRFLWVPIVFCIFVSGLIALPIALLLDIPEYGLPEEELGFGGALINALIFIGIGGASAFILIRLVRKRGINALEKVMLVAFLFLGIFIVYFHGLNLLVAISIYLVPIDEAWGTVWLAVSIVVGIALAYVYASPKYSERGRNVAVLIYGVLIGSYLPSVIPTWSGILILIGFSLYDIYAVKRGPIKEMMEHINGAGDGDGYYSGAGDDSGEMAGDDEYEMEVLSLDIGIGDLAFYSMLTSISLISEEFGGPLLYTLSGGNVLAYFLPFLFTMSGVLIGAFISYQFVKKSKILPGLPMSIFIGIGLLSLSILIGTLAF